MPGAGTGTSSRGAAGRTSVAFAVAVFGVVPPLAGVAPVGAVAACLDAAWPGARVSSTSTSMRRAPTRIVGAREMRAVICSLVAPDVLVPCGASCGCPAARRLPDAARGAVALGRGALARAVSRCPGRVLSVDSRPESCLERICPVPSPRVACSSNEWRCVGTGGPPLHGLRCGEQVYPHSRGLRCLPLRLSGRRVLASAWRARELTVRGVRAPVMGCDARRVERRFRAPRQYRTACAAQARGGPPGDAQMRGCASDSSR